MELVVEGWWVRMDGCMDVGWKSDVKVNVRESNFYVVKYLSLKFGIYMDYFGTDVWKLEMKYEWWSDFKAWLLGLTIKGTIRCFMVIWWGFGLDYWVKWWLFLKDGIGWWWDREIEWSDGFGSWCVDEPAMWDFRKFRQFADFNYPRLTIRIINRSQRHFTPKNRYFIGHNTILIQFKKFWQ